MDDLVVAAAELAGPEARLLIGLLDEELGRRYPEEGANHFELDAGAFTRPEQRGQGVARVLLGALERTARTLGVARLVLETGNRQPEAIALYERSGFVRTAPFGAYVGSPLSVCMAKPLV